MTDNALTLSRIERLLDEIEQLEIWTNGEFRQASDREAFNIAARIERKMQQRTRTKPNESEE